MRVALDVARAGARDGEPPFGAVVVDADGRELARAHDRVHARGDLSRHSELEAVQAACAMHGPDLSGSTLYASTEPCAMCFTSAWLARVSRVVWGCSINDMLALDPTARQVLLPAATVNAATPAPIALEGGVLRAEALEVLRGIAPSAAA